MSYEDLKSAHVLFNRLECNKCKTEFDDSPKFSRVNDGSDLLFTTDYTCPDCDTDYNIRISDVEAGLSIKTYLSVQDPDTDVARIHSVGIDPLVKMETHNFREILDNLNELKQALKILYVNGRRIIESCEEFRENGFDGDRAFNTEVITDLHNYAASAYSFDQIFHTTQNHLPTDGDVPKSREEYKEKYHVIEGLRVYSQHNLTIPVNYSYFYNPDLDTQRSTITVPLDEVQTIESDVDRYPPYGYNHPSKDKNSGWNPYSEIGFDKIDVEYYVEGHFNAAKSLVRVIWKYAYEKNEDEFKDYIELQRSL
ncbi:MULTISPECIES: hypothetical protein [unclassified Haladaptatus]|uniref:hypothetical protein n=1 Tax=unclassified Haladaptatus TaxID=2622732 RepID=UPI00209BD37A|nr:MULTISPECIES: hypothetical protein [unclassified Haladaptatus]MCO8243131.1 hypothetical protein [Haladaptatus sp. AB643]MCO8252843.1 hypothetical protein [Haladaptatus sp. AB618]